MAIDRSTQLASPLHRALRCLAAAALLFGVFASSAPVHAGLASSPEACGTSAVRSASSGATECSPPPPPSVAEVVLHRRSGTASAWLANGVRVHHRSMVAESARRGRAAHAAVEAAAGEPPAEGGGRVIITVLVAGGEVLECTTTRGMAQAAVVAWRHPATRSMSSPQMAALLEQHDIRLGARAEQDSIILRLDAPAAEASAALQIAHRLLTEPVIEPQAMESWVTAAAARSEDAARGAGRAGGGAGGAWASRRHAAELLRCASLPADEPRFRPVSADQVRAVTAAAAQAWLNRVLLGEGNGNGGASRPAPIEAAIVGDIAVDEALRLAAEHLGSLPPRDRIGPETFRQPRAVCRNTGVLEVSMHVEGGEPMRGFVAAGFFGNEVMNFRDHRALWLAGQVLEERTTVCLREHGWAGLDDVSVLAVPGGLTPADAGVLVVTAQVPPDQAEAAAAAILECVGELTEQGPTADELARARQHLLREAGGMLDSASYWSAALAHSTYRGYSPESIPEVMDVLRKLDAAAVTEVLRKYNTPQRRIRLIACPRQSDEAVE